MILGNYNFLNKLPGHDEDFVNHNGRYLIICMIQVTDIVLNFFKIPTIEGHLINDPVQVMLIYLKSSFIPDTIAVMPYNQIAPKLIFLRFLKFCKYNTY